jgi:hypothetical protein
MASPCELLVDGGSQAHALRVVRVAARRGAPHRAQVQPLPQRQRGGAPAGGGGQAVIVDDETAGLLDFAARCHALSGGLFDVTSGVLRAAWRFDGSSQLPDPALVESLLPRVGWPHVCWQRPRLRLPGHGTRPRRHRQGVRGRPRAGSADGAHTLPLLVNLGGDLVASGRTRRRQPWTVGIEQPGEGGTPATWTTPAAAPAHAQLPACRRAGHQRRRTPLPAEGRGALRPHPRPAQRLAGARRAAFGDGGRAHLHRSRRAVHAGHAAGRGAEAWLAGSTCRTGCCADGPRPRHCRTPT